MPDPEDQTITWDRDEPDPDITEVRDDGQSISDWLDDFETACGW